MPPIASPQWISTLDALDYAFQPIVNIHTGVCYGVEALLRNTDTAGFKTIGAFFDHAWRDGVLHQVDMHLRHKAIEKLAGLENREQVKLFFNLDNRILNSEDYQSGNTIRLLKTHHLHHDAICFEISERHQILGTKTILGVLDNYRAQGFKIAVDDFGAGFSGLQTLYYTEPDFIKIDRFFIQDISNDHKKRLFVSNIVNTAHIMGSIVVAEGVETEQEYYGCRDIGCDMIQGYLVQRPQLDTATILKQYTHILQLSQTDHRLKVSQDKKLIDTEMDYLPPIVYSENIFDIFEQFRTKVKNTFIPVINHNAEPLGVIRESTLKEYAYSPYGRELLKNPAFAKKMGDFVVKFPVADIHASVEEVLQIYSRNETLEGILITENMQYKGFLSAQALLKILNEKNLSIARDQNPLSRLPGNTLIHEYVSTALENTQTPCSLIYFDFDNFKPFNDKYGFRSGDRLILLFADLLKKKVVADRIFAGHVGGDDFFMGIRSLPFSEIEAKIGRLIQQFRKNAESFYDPEAICAGYIESPNREGLIQRFPLIAVSAVVLHLPSGRQIYTTDEISRTLAEHKKKAKCSPTSMFVHTVCIEKTDCCVSHAFQTCLPEKDFQRRVSYHNFDPEKEIFGSPARFAPISVQAVRHAAV